MEESRSEVSLFIPEQRYFAEVIRLPADVKNYCLKETFKEIKNVNNYKTFLMENPEKGYTVTPCMDFYKANIQYDGSIDKLKLRTLVRGDLQKKEMI